MLWDHVLIWGMIFSTLIIIIVGVVFTVLGYKVSDCDNKENDQEENYSSPVYDQWHPPNYFQGEETVNPRERYFDWMPYPHLYTNINLGSWDKPKPIQPSTVPKSTVALTTTSKTS